jgi:hypothetical protein
LLTSIASVPAPKPWLTKLRQPPQSTNDTALTTAKTPWNTTTRWGCNNFSFRPLNFQPSVRRLFPAGIFDIPPLFLADLPLGQPDDYSVPSFSSECSPPTDGPTEPPSSLVDSDATSVLTLSTVSTLLILEDEDQDPLSLDAPPAEAERRGRPSGARLDAVWQTFFRDALQPPTADPLSTTRPSTSPPLPPPLNPASNDPVGDPFTQCDPSQNANGLSVKDDYSAWHALCTNLVPQLRSVIALSEPNIDFLQQDVRRNIEEVFKLHFGSVSLITATTCAKAPTPWKPGGVLLAVLGKWTQHVTTTSRDDLGRWVSATFCGSDGTQATVYSCYNVVNTSIANVGPSTVFAQQYQLLRLAGNAQPNPRKQFADDLNKDLAARHRNSVR